LCDAKASSLDIRPSRLASSLLEVVYPQCWIGKSGVGDAIIDASAVEKNLIAICFA
jgi:hypothetical protein